MKSCNSRFYKKARWVAAGILMLFFTTSCTRMILPLLDKSLTKADVQWPLPPPALLALENGQKIHRLKVDQLTQFTNGPGIIIAPPSSASSANSNLGHGVARWLEYNLGGLPAFDKNSSWDAYTESISYLQRQEISSDADAAKILAENSGATHVAMGHLAVDGNHLSLSYQWRKFPDNQLMEETVLISGSPSEIVKQLPQLAEKLAAQLNVKSTFKAPKESDAQLRELGNLPLSPQVDLPDAAIASLAQLATISAPAQMMYLTFLVDSNYDSIYPSHQTWVEWKKVVTELITTNPSNTFAWQYIAEHYGKDMLGNEAKLIALGKAYPQNYLINFALTKMYANQNKMQQRRDFSEVTLRCNRQNPRAWTQMADTIFQEADSVRHACYWPAMNAEQQAFVSARYEECLSFLKVAAQFSHRSASVWANISMTATFAGDDKLIQVAMQKALEADPFSRNALGWALQIYQPKWGGTTDELLPIVKRIKENPLLYIQLYKEIRQAIAASGSIEGVQASRGEVKQVLEKWLKEHPHDYAARSTYGEVLWQLKDIPNMKIQEEILMKERPHDRIGYMMRASRFYAMREYANASEYYKKALQYHPHSFNLHYDLGRTYHLRGQFLGERELFPLAREEYEKAIQINPIYVDSYNQLGDLYIYVFNDPQKAAELYGKAVSIVLGNGRYWANLGYAHFLLGQKDLALQEGNHALQLGYNKQHPLWDKLENMQQ